MFDPLDFFNGPEHSASQDSEPAKIEYSQQREASKKVTVADQDLKIHSSTDDVDVPAQVIDLPMVQIAEPVVILTVLLLLRPPVDVNFTKGNRENSGTNDTAVGTDELPLTFIQETVDWYRYVGNPNLDSASKLWAKVPRLAATATEKNLVTYYTTVLARYSRIEQPDEVVARILSEASLRISEKCGRTAQPAMTRVFQVEGLQKCIKLHEPSLTADNLGLKTWGASLVLAQKLCQNVHEVIDGRKQPRVLELGAGTGLVGIALIQKLLEAQEKCPAITFHLTDLPEIVPNLIRNVELNNCNQTSDLTVIADVLDWTDPSYFRVSHGSQKFDVLLIADPLYSPQHPQWIIDMIVEFLAPGGTVYLELPVRAKYTVERQRLWDLIKAANLEFIKEETDEGLDDWGQVSYLYKEIVYRTPL
ncbi:LAME_0F18382g1_1 [Lachancea meyersii CBS 8951]|uniref:LAME_0F18382g1_1 n=1 Tax=Lachancea meyersii CBS 8951 TaxID=1266667 RepID=A0A1G4K0P3_9SACH|nr:LAME_0F18382g1_1 [Lachancea meyersii CBS 8951]